MIFRHLDYRDYIKEVVKDKTSAGKKFNYQTLASKMRVQKSYLSRVVKGDAQLNQDQAYLLGAFLQLNSTEQKYLELLVEYDRTSLNERKREIKHQILTLQKQQISSDQFLHKNLHENNLMEYYTQPLMQVVHISLLLEQPQKANLERIKSRLGIDDNQLNSIIEKLKNLGLVSLRNNQFVNEAKGMHLKSDHPLTQLNHTLMRNFTINQLMKINKDEAFTFSATFSANRETFLEIKSEFLNYLNRIEHPIDEAAAENSYQINFDLFPWLY